MGGKPGELTKKDFKKKVLGSKVPFLVCFATSSSPCRILEPQIAALVEEWKGKMDFGTVDARSGSRIAREYSISSVPTLLLFKEGKIVERIVGLKSRDVIKAQLESHIL